MNKLYLYTGSYCGVNPNYRKNSTRNKWILKTGYWNDNGEWIDTKNWID